ncbi:hypothetical protein KY360_00510 [Candidatus Woesearchaeota archaeon]|nr:hypothetical protein [Candidatus Woesearchaeota archaeon]
MKLFCSKRGTIAELVTEPPFVMALVIFALLSVTGIITGYLHTDRGFEKSYLAIYSGTTIEALFPAFVNIVYEPGIDTLGFTFNISNGRVTVFDQLENENPPESLRRRYIFTGDNSVVFSGGLLKPRFRTKGDEKELDRKIELKFVKHGNELIVGDKNDPEIKPNLNRQVCLDINTHEDLGAKKVLLPERILVRSDLSDKKLKDEISNSDIAVKVYQDRSTDNTVIAYIPIYQDKLRKNEKFACLLLNELTDSDELGGKAGIENIAIVPTSDYPILNNDNVAVLLGFKSDKNLAAELDLIGRLIENAIKEYYS